MIIIKKITAWLEASRLPSQSYIFFPLLLGQAISFWQQGFLSGPIFIIVHLFGLFIQLYIVYANDYADRFIDQHNETYNLFTGGSRVLVEGKLTNKSIKKAIFLTVALNLILGIILTVFYKRQLAIPLIIFALFLLWAYSYKPLELSYRGGGEFLQMIGVAGVLPLFAYYAQSGMISSFPWLIIIMLLPNHLGCALSTGVPDYPSDKKGGKKTFSVIFTPFNTKILIIILNFLSLAILLGVDIIAYRASIAIAIIPLLMNFLVIYFRPKAEPGSQKLLYFVSANIAGVVSFNLGLCIYFFIF